MTTCSAAGLPTTLLNDPPAGRGLSSPVSDWFRSDIQGLRGFAVLAVLVYHLNSGWLPGGFVGVDVFFVISGYLITLQLINEVRQTGTLCLRRFWARRMLRLIPAASVVLLATAGLVFISTPRTGWVRFGVDFAAAAGYSLNWVLAERSVDYLSVDAVASPVQHYWSLGVEEQFYLIWPAVILGLVVFAQRWGVRVQPLLWGCIAASAAASFGFSTFRVKIGDPSAFFTTTSRFWELAIGAMAAMVVLSLQSVMSAFVRSTAVTVGLGLMVATLVFVDEMRWPGSLALLPTVGTALVLLGGGSSSPRGAEKMLGTRWLAWVGGISYTVYLWHWPIINLARRRWGDLSVLQCAVIVAVSVVLAWLTQRFVENPIRFSPWFRVGTRRPFALAAACLGIGMVVSVTLVVFGPRLALVPLNARPAGAAVLPDRIDLTEHPVWSRSVKWALPSAVDAIADVPRAYADGCQQSSYAAAPLSCTYGDTTSDTVVALAGDSKALQWLPALETWAATHRIKIVTYTKSNCPLADVSVLLPNGQPYPACKEWYGRVMVELLRSRPALVVTSQFQSDGQSVEGQPPTSAAMIGGLERTWGVLTGAGMAVAVIADIPDPSASISECVVKFDRNLERCEYVRTVAIANSAQPAQFGASEALEGRVIDASGETQSGTNPSLVLFDLTDAICPDLNACPPVVGNVLIYRPGAHLTKTYVDSTAGRLSRLLDDARLI